jgi:hypothetical protein
MAGFLTAFLVLPVGRIPLTEGQLLPARPTGCDFSRHWPGRSDPSEATRCREGRHHPLGL